jgi:hypothetical protein
MIDEVGEAVQLETTGATGAARAAAWQAQADRELARLKQVAADLKPMPAELQARYAATGPVARGQIKGFLQMPGLARDLLRETESQIEANRPLLSSAASGDAAAKLTLARRTISGIRLLVQSEIAMMDLAIVTAASSDHPQVAVAMAGKASDEGLIEVLRYLEAGLNPGEPPNPTSVGRAVAAKAAESRKAAALAWPRAQALSAQLNRQLPPGEMRTAIGRAMATYEESGKVETAIADILTRISDNLLADPDKIDPETWPLDDLEPLADRRVALQQERTALFAKR